MQRTLLHSTTRYPCTGYRHHCRRVTEVGTLGPRAPPSVASVYNQLSPLEEERSKQSRTLEQIVEALNIDSLTALAFHSPDDIRGLVASEPVKSAALVTVPIGSTLAVLLDVDGGQLSILSPPEIPPNVKKAIEIVAGLIHDTPDYQLLILAVLLLWARKHGGEAWAEYCRALLPPARELSCLLSYSPAELTMLQLSHLRDEAAGQHDWARWAHTQWLSSASGALRRLGLADDLEDTVWALAAVRSRAVEFPVGIAAGGSSTAAADAASASMFTRGHCAGPIVTVLPPVIDLANHSADPNCVVQLTTDRSRVVLLPRRPIAAGEPLTVDYGYDRNSLELMVDYGFVAPGNRQDGDLPLPEADKLPPLEISRLEAAARALQRERKRQRASQRQLLPAASKLGAVAGGAGGVAAAGEGASLALARGGPGDGEEEEEEEEELEDAEFSGRVRAAIRLLAPRSVLSNPTQGFSSPATQRIIAGLWHKLIRHCADGYATSLEQDIQLLYDIEAGRVSGFTAGVPLSLDPAPVRPPPPRRVQQPGATVAGTTQRPPSPAAAAWSPSATSRPGTPAGEAGGGPGVGGASVPGTGPASSDRPSAAAAPAAAKTVDIRTEEMGSGANGGDPGSASDPGPFHAQRQAAAASDSSAAGAGVQAGPGLLDGSFHRDGEVGPLPLVDRSDVAGAAAASPPAPQAVCRTGRRAGRLYAAVRARLEYKEVLRVAEHLLLLYTK